MKNNLFLVLVRKLPDKFYLTFKFYKTFRRFPNWRNPKSFNEKLQWLKLYDRKPEYTTMVDKYAVKKYVANLIGEEFIIPTLGVWEKPEEIEWDKLPTQFVLKTTHGGGNEGVVVCQNKETFDCQKAIDLLNDNLKLDLYYINREWPYKNVKPRIIAEKYMKDESGYELKDYKFFCFNGICEIFKVDFDRQKNHHANYFSRACELMPFGEVLCPPDYNRKLEIPSNVDEMINKAELIASFVNNAFVRVDLYNINGHIYFGEITFYPASGFGKFEPEDWDCIFGHWLELPPKTNRSLLRHLYQ